MTLRGCALILALAAAPPLPGATPVTVAADWTRVGARIPDHFVGLSVFAARLRADGSGQPTFRLENETLLRMFRALGVRTLRIKGEGSIEAAAPQPRPADLDCLHWFALAADTTVRYGDSPAVEFCDDPGRRFPDSYAAARWILDYAFRRAEAGAGEVTFGTGTDGCIPRALALGLNAFDRTAHGRLVPAGLTGPPGARIFAHAVAGDDGRLYVTLVDQDSRDFAVRLSAGRAVSEVLRVCAPGGAQVDSRGVASGAWVRPPAGRPLHLPAASALLVRCDP